MGTLKYTTTVSAQKTAGEMAVMLAKHGAAEVTTLYDEDARLVGLTFTLRTPHGPRKFSLPIKVHNVLRLLEKQSSRREIRTKFSQIDQAERTAWRVARDWLAAQLAILEADMAALDEIMLPYLLVDAETQERLYDRYLGDHEETLALPARTE
jgi:hypothetical protein